MLAQLETLDRQLGDSALSFDPARQRATPLVVLGDCCGLEFPELAEALVQGLCSLVQVMIAEFPENQGWDLDFPIRSIAQTSRAVGGSTKVASIFAEWIELQSIYGRSGLGFRYTTDFLYGYDWAKWVLADREDRHSEPPFGPRFFAHLRRRGRELKSALKPGDGEAMGALFPFSRAPRDEVRLHTELARRGLVPVASWSVNGHPKAIAPKVREQVAVELGLGCTPLAQ